ncbi:response regulator [candidate division KSB1 bacterium]|nr:MAG: response regulator [candidate division KSB1 bacterium]
MMKHLVLCVDDQREVLGVLRKDLAFLEPGYTIIECESAQEADEVIQERKDDSVAMIICDHIMPGENGVDFLARVTDKYGLKKTKKLLLTGLATQQDTIRAINEARVDGYIEKPWEEPELKTAVTKLLSEYTEENSITDQALTECLK